MPKGSKPGDLVIWYAAGRQQYIARGWVDAIPTQVREGPGRYRAPVVGMEWIEPVDRRKAIRDCGFDGGVQSYQTVEDEFVMDLLQSLGLAHLTPRFKIGQLCPTCHSGHAADWDLRQLRLRITSTVPRDPYPALGLVIMRHGPNQVHGAQIILTKLQGNCAMVNVGMGFELLKRIKGLGA
jgi:hypothetical protein